jgi:HrpA-like RNA helicase
MMSLDFDRPRSTLKRNELFDQFLFDQMEEARHRYSPLKEFRENLPVFESKLRIVDAVRRHRVVIISGETGSGKTTQV